MESGGRRSVLSHRGSGPLSATFALSPATEDPPRRDTQQSAHSVSSRRSSVRKSGRASSRYSHSSYTRGSVRGARGGGGSQAVDGGGFDRILCIDEEGRDRTPKPLLAPRLHAEPLPSSGWGGDGTVGSADSGSDHAQERALSQLAGIPSARSWLASEATEASLDGAGLPPGMRAPGRLSMAHAAGREASFNGAHGSAEPSAHAVASGRASVLMMQANNEQLQQEGAGPAGVAWQLSGGVVDAGGTEPALLLPHMQLLRPGHEASQQQHAQPQQQSIRSKASQCATVQRVSRGVQVLPWEMRAESGNAPAGNSGFAGEAGDAGVSDELDEEAALLALQQRGAGSGGAGGREAHRGSTIPTHRSGASSQYSSRRGSVADPLRRMSSLSSTAEDWSRPPTSSASSRRTSIVASDWGARDSLMSTRTSFAALMADGRGSLMGSAQGFYPPGVVGGSGSNRPHTGRASVMSTGQGQGRRGTAVAGQPAAAAAPPQPSPEQLAAAAARRHKAQQERALARMPGLLHKLKAVEKAVLLNLQHAKLAQYHSVQLCRVAPSGRDGPEDSPRDGTVTAEAAVAPSCPLLPSRRGTAASMAASFGRREDGRSSLSVAGASVAGTPPALGGLAPRHQAAELPFLWAWGTELSGELPVSCLAWSKAAPGLLAVGYGRLEYEVSGAGLVAVWSLSHPSHPVWHATTPRGVSALDWSSKAHGTLAVGFFDGSIAIYDMAAGGSSSKGSSKADVQPVARAPPAGAGPSTGSGHAEPVWRLRYVPQATDPSEETLVSISSDGRVLEWKHAQGLERSELLHIKRLQPSGSKARELQRAGSGIQKHQHGAQEVASKGFLGRAGGGTCFDFSATDPRTYLIGTEEGAVHKCSTVFSEQYIQSYLAHLGPVYQVTWSPFSPSHFLTASADWSVRLWSEAQPRSLWTFQLPTSQAEVADVAFSPASATMFAAAAGNSVQLWDVEHSVLAPRGAAVRLGLRLTALAFSKAAPVLVAGADDGSVSVYSLAGFCDADMSAIQPEEQQNRLEDALRRHTAQHISD